jgi:hypothetical protein
MKKLYLAFIFLAVTIFQIQSQNLLTEDFLYQAVDSLENSGNWFRSGINTEYNIKVVSPGLEYPDYPGSGRGNTVLIANSGNGDILYHHFSKAVTSGSVYLSFLFRSDSLPTSVTQGNCISFNPNTGGTFLNTSLNIRRISESSFNLGIRKSEGVEFINSVYEVGKTYLVVLKYSFIPGSENDISSIYVFENSVPRTEPAQTMAFSTQGEDHPGQGSVVLINNYAQNGMKGCHIEIDGIRVGTSWESSVLAPVISGTADIVTSDLQIENFPNPFSEQTRIKVNLPAQGWLRMNIYNAAGMKVAELFQGNHPEGNFEVIWDARNFPAGLYSCIIQLNGLSAQKQLILVK